MTEREVFVLSAVVQLGIYWLPFSSSVSFLFSFFQTSFSTFRLEGRTTVLHVRAYENERADFLLPSVLPRVQLGTRRCRGFVQNCFDTFHTQSQKLARDFLGRSGRASSAHIFRREFSCHIVNFRVTSSEFCRKFFEKSGAFGTNACNGYSLLCRRVTNSRDGVRGRGSVASVAHQESAARTTPGLLLTYTRPASALRQRILGRQNSR